MRRFIVTLFVSISAFHAAAPRSRADDRYYMIMFASQAEPNRPKLAHTFAVFVEASGDGKDPSKYKVESRCISWLPKSLVIDPLRLQPEPGVNLNLSDSLKFAKSSDAQVTMWGPFVIQKKCYDMALKRFDALKSGKIDYVVFDRRFRNGAATNCIHAVSDLDVEQPPLLTGTAHGNDASQLVLKHLEKWILPSKGDLSWLPERLELRKDQVRTASLERTASR